MEVGSENGFAVSRGGGGGGGGGCSEVESEKGQEPPPPPPQTPGPPKKFLRGKLNYEREKILGPFLVHTILVHKHLDLRPLRPVPPSSKTSLGGGFNLLKKGVRKGAQMSEVRYFQRRRHSEKNSVKSAPQRKQVFSRTCLRCPCHGGLSTSHAPGGVGQWRSKMELRVSPLPSLCSRRRNKRASEPLARTLCHMWLERSLSDTARVT